MISNNLANIPDELRQRRQWVCYKMEPIDPQNPDELAKIPRKPNGGARARINEPDGWADFDFALEASPRYHGIEYMLSADDPYTFVDLDHCVEDGQIEPWALRIIHDFDSYTEFSRSGSGIHILVSGSKPGPRCKNTRDYPQIEIYDHSRPIVMTGDIVPGCKNTIEPAPNEIATLYHKLFGDDKPSDNQATALPANQTAADISDSDLIEKILTSKCGPSFSLLWNGNTSEYNGDDSSAAQALCNYLAWWTNKDADRMDRLFRMSGLMRSKWDDRRGQSSWGAITIQNAIRGCQGGYTGHAPPQRGKNKGNGNGNGKRDSDCLPTATELHYTDLGNARRLVEMHGSDLRYCHPWAKWFVWDGARWSIDGTAEIMRRAKETVASIYAEAAGADGDDRKDIAKHALRSEAMSRIEAMVHLAESEPQIPITPEQLDCDPWLLSVRNGTINLQTGKIRKQKPEDFITKLAPVVYDPDATCPQWDSFLLRIMNCNTDLIDFLRRAVGYSLTGDVSERVMFILHGTGANGKSTFLDVLQALLGAVTGYAMRTPAETLLVKREGSIPNDVARLKGARFVFASETDQGKRLAEALIKDITGGDTVSARFMRGEWFDFAPEFKIWLATNHKPVIKGTDNAIWDRLKLIPFTVTIPEPERIPRRLIMPLLCGELPGILNWALRGCLEWQDKGLGVPDAVREATAGYREEMDILASFLADCCIEKVSLRALNQPLYATYKKWCENSGEHILSQRSFSNLLIERGFAKGISHGKRFWRGLGLIDESQETLPDDAEGYAGYTTDPISHISSLKNSTHVGYPKNEVPCVPCVPPEHENKAPYWVGDDNFDPFGTDDPLAPGETDGD